MRLVWVRVVWYKLTKQDVAEESAAWDTTEMGMIRWLCGFTVKDRTESTKLREPLWLTSVSLVIRKGMTQWYGHVECKDETDMI